MPQTFLQKTSGAVFILVWVFASLFMGIDVTFVSAEDSAVKKPGPVAAGGDDFSTENLNKQITDLEIQIQKLRDQSIELQEKTRAKLQAQLENFKKQQDTLIPRIEQLRDNSESAWQDIKENIQKAIEDLKHSVDTMKK